MVAFMENPAKLIADTLLAGGLGPFPIQKVNTEKVEISSAKALAQKFDDKAVSLHGKSNQAANNSVRNQGKHDRFIAAAETSQTEQAFGADVAKADKAFVRAQSDNVTSHALDVRALENKAKGAAAENASNITKAVVKEEMRKAGAMADNSKRVAVAKLDIEPQMSHLKV